MNEDIKTTKIELSPINRFFALFIFFPWPLFFLGSLSGFFALGTPGSTSSDIILAWIILFAIWTYPIVVFMSFVRARYPLPEAFPLINILIIFSALSGILNSLQNFLLGIWVGYVLLIFMAIILFFIGLIMLGRILARR